MAQKFQVKCPACGCELEINSELAGKEVKCPCSNVFRIGAIKAPPASPKVEFRCPSCSQLLQSEVNNVGKQAVCTCGAAVVITNGASQPLVVQPLQFNQPTSNISGMGAQSSLPAENLSLIHI